MKILLISALFPPHYYGGYELRALDIAKKMAAEGHMIRVLTSDHFTDDENELDFLDVRRDLFFTPYPTYEDCLSGAFKKENLKRSVSHILNFEPELIVLFDIRGISGVLLYYLLQRAKLPVVHILGDDNFSFLHNTELRNRIISCFGSFDFPDFTYIPVSQRLSREIHKNSGLIMRKKHVSPSWYIDSGMPAKEFEKKNHFIFASTLRGSHKGGQILLAAMKILHDEGMKNFSLDLYGDADKDTVQNIKTVLEAYNLSDKIVYQGKLSKQDLLKKYAEYDAFILPTWQREPCGCVFAEAASSGALPIMTDACGASEYFLDGYDCIKAARNPAAFAVAIKKYMQLSDTRGKTMRQNAMQTALNYFYFPNLYTEHMVIFNKNSKKFSCSVEMLRKIEKDLYDKTADLRLFK